MAYERNDRDFPLRGRNDERRRSAASWTRDDERGYHRRRLDDADQSEDAYRDARAPGGRDYDDRWSNAGGYYGEPDRRLGEGGGHAFDFARRDSGAEGQRAFEDYGDPVGYGPRRSGFDPRYSGRGRGSYPGSPREDWADNGDRISRYVSAEERTGENRPSARTGSFRGRGPKGYVRSDERIKEDVSDRLTDEDTLDASDISVEVAGGEVTLFGFVDSRQAKHTAEDCTEQCAGVRHVQNNLRVRTAADTDDKAPRPDAEPLGNGAK